MCPVFCKLQSQYLFPSVTLSCATILQLVHFPSCSSKSHSFSSMLFKQFPLALCLVSQFFIHSVSTSETGKQVVPVLDPGVSSGAIPVADRGNDKGAIIRFTNVKDGQVNSRFCYQIYAKFNDIRFSCFTGVVICDADNKLLYL